jgi:hypothetical protein
MTKSFNRVYQDTATTGTVTVTLGSASAANAITFAQAGAIDGNIVNYVIEDGTDFEVGTGTIGGAGTTLTRTTVEVSKIGATIGTTKLTLSGSARVRSVESARYFNADVLNKDVAKLNDLADVDTVTIPPAAGDGLTFNGTNYVPGAAGGGMFRGNNGTVGSRSGDIFRINAKTLTVNVTIGATENASVTGPLEIATGVTLEVATGGTLVIL